MKNTAHTSSLRHLLAAGLAMTAAVGAALADGEPPIAYETVLPGYNLSHGADLAVDADGNAFVLAANHNDATRNDVILAKLDPGGNVLWERYLRGGSIDIAGGIALDAQGDLWVTGWTDSADFPITADAIDNQLTGFRDVFVTKLASTDGSVLYSTYIGGDYVDGGNDIAIGDDGRVFITGFSASTDYPTTADAIQPDRNGHSYAFTDNILTILSPDGTSVLYSTYYGGSEDEEAQSIALDANGDIVIGGWTQSTDYPTHNPFQANYAGGERDAFVTRFLTDGSAIDFSTYLGGEDWDFFGRLDVGPNGGIFVTGSTRSITFPTTSGSFQPNFDGDILGCEVPFGQDYNCEDMFLTKLAPDGTQLDYSTYLGGSRPDEARGVAVDNLGRAHLVGYSYSADFPGTDDQYTVLTSRISADGSTLDYIHARFSGSCNAGHGITVGGDGAVYLTGAVNVPADIYVVKLEGQCLADFNGDGATNTQDVLAFLNAWAAGDSSADINGDGTVNTQDVLAFLNLWAAGC
jgi:hypothetical protein